MPKLPCCKWLIPAALLLSAPLLDAQPPKDKGKQPAQRHIFVLHDGFHTILSYRKPNWAVEDMKAFLVKHGVAPADIVTMPCPFQPASPKDPFPKAGFEFFLNCFDPTSKASQDSYRTMDKLLLAAGARVTDKLIWIGHSAGGQVGMTMAQLGGALDKYPELARTTTPHPFDMVVTLGTPLNWKGELLPPGVKQRIYYSPRDRVVHLAWVVGNLALPLLGYESSKVDFVPVPSPLQADAVIRVFYGIEHPVWPKSEHVMRRILNECRPDCHPAWRAGAISPSVGAGLAGLLCQALDEHGQLSLEDPFGN